MQGDPFSTCLLPGKVHDPGIQRDQQVDAAAACGTAFTSLYRAGDMLRGDVCYSNVCHHFELLRQLAGVPSQAGSLKIPVRNSSAPVLLRVHFASAPRKRIEAHNSMRRFHHGANDRSINISPLVRRRRRPPGPGPFRASSRISGGCRDTQ